MTFAATLKQEQARLGLSQENLAKALDVSPRTIWSWLLGHKEPKSVTKEGVLARLSKLPIDDASSWRFTDVRSDRWQNVQAQIPRTQDVANTTDSPERLSASVLFAVGIAQCCHESASLIDGDPCSWDELGKGEQEQAIAHIQFRMEHPDAPISAWHTRENPQGCKWDEVCMWRKIRAAMYLAVIRSANAQAHSLGGVAQNINEAQEVKDHE